MSDRESQQASIDASEASLPAENGSREVEHDPPPLGSEENYSHRRSPDAFLSHGGLHISAQ